MKLEREKIYEIVNKCCDGNSCAGTEGEEGAELLHFRRNNGTNNKFYPVHFSKAKEGAVCVYVCIYCIYYMYVHINAYISIYVYIYALI